MAQRPEELVELLPEAAPFLAREAAVTQAGDRRGLVLVHDLAGEFDAAHAGALAGAHLLAGLPHEVIARFDADALVDYRAHRPAVTFSGDRYESFDAPPDPAVRRWRTTRASRSCCCTAPSPTTRGSASSPPSAGLVERLGVTSVVSLQAIPMPVPHTRPVTVTAHATRRQLIDSYPVLLGRDADSRQRLGAAGAAARGVGHRRAGSGRARAALPGAGHLSGRVADACSSTSSG